MGPKRENEREQVEQEFSWIQYKREDEHANIGVSCNFITVSGLVTQFFLPHEVCVCVRVGLGGGGRERQVVQKDHYSLVNHMTR